MPLFPSPAAGTAAMPGAIYSALADKIAQIDGPIFPLHVGDTFMEPLEGARLEHQTVAKHRWGMHKYTRPQGHAPLIDALVEKCRTRNHLPVERAGVTVTAGATAGLAAVLGAICNPGDEVLILAPFWPLIRGHVQCFHGVPVEVPFYDRVDSVEADTEIQKNAENDQNADDDSEDSPLLAQFAATKLQQLFQKSGYSCSKPEPAGTVEVEEEGQK